VGAKKKKKKISVIQLVRSYSVNVNGTKWKYLTDKAEVEIVLCKHLNGQAVFKVTLGNNTQEDDEISGPRPRK
jgi:hypothetical protein